MYFHGFGGGKEGFNGDLKRFTDSGMAAFSMTELGFKKSCGKEDAINALNAESPGACDKGFIHLMDSRYEVRDAQYLVSVLADEGLIQPKKIGTVGASYGGMVALAFAERFPARVARLLTIGAADRTHPMATAWRSVQRHVLRSAIERGEGAQGVALARALAMATYRSPGEFAERFRAPPRNDNGTYVFPVEDYLFARGAEYATRYRPEAFLCLSESIDLHHVDAERIRVPTTIVAVREDQIVPLGDLHELRARLGAYGRLIEISSRYGHDAFLKEAAQLGPILKSTLESQS